MCSFGAHYSRILGCVSKTKAALHKEEMHAYGGVYDTRQHINQGWRPYCL